MAGVKTKKKRSLTQEVPATFDTSKKRRGKSEAKQIESELEEEGFISREENETGFFDDLVWVYQQIGGRKELLKMAKKDPRMKAQVFQALLRMESKAQELETRKKLKSKDGDKKGMLLIFKGLEDHEKGLKIADGKVSRREVASILEPASDMNEEVYDDRDEKYQYQIQDLEGKEDNDNNKIEKEEVTDEEEENDEEKEDRDVDEDDEGREGYGEDDRESVGEIVTEEDVTEDDNIIMDDVVDA